MYPQPEVAGQAHQTQHALLETPQPHRDHVWVAQRLAAGRHTLGQMPRGLPLCRRTRRNRHVLALMRERFLTLIVPKIGPTHRRVVCDLGTGALGGDATVF